MEVSTASSAPCNNTSATSSAATGGGRLLHEQLRAEIALLQLELNQLTTVNSQLLRRQERQPEPPKPVIAVDVAVDATSDAGGLSPVPARYDDHHYHRRCGDFDLDDHDWTTTVATPSPVIGSRGRVGSIYGSSASRLCPVVVAGDEEPSFRVCEVGTDARGHSVIVHSARRAAAPVPPVAGVEAGVGPDAGDVAANGWRSMCAVSADECASVAEMLVAAAQTMAAGERVLLGDGAVTSCDLADAPQPMSALLRDFDDDDDADAPSRARANAAAAFAHLKATVEHVHDRATELRDTALARQVALSTYLQRCEIDRRDAEIEVQDRLAASEARAEASASELVDVHQLLAEAQAATTDLENQLVATYRDYQAAAEARTAAELEASNLRHEAAQTSAALYNAQAENAALKQALERMETHAARLEAAVVKSAATVLPMSCCNDDTPDREFRPSAGTAGGASSTTASPQSVGDEAGHDVTPPPSSSSVRRRHAPITSPAVEEEEGCEGEGVEQQLAHLTTDPVAVSAIQHLTKELLRRQHHLALPAAA